jgi:hypothetical protein
VFEADDQNMKIPSIKTFLNSTLIVILLFTGKTNATSYYVDSADGNDNNNGTSTTTPWKTLSKVCDAATTFQPGDIISFKRGEIWYGERLTPTAHASGISGNPIIYNSYGNGNRPIFNLIITQTPEWTDEGNNIWSAIIGAGARFFKNGIEMLRNPLPDRIPLGTQGTQYYTELINEGNNLKLYIYSTTNPKNDSYKWTAYNIGLYFPNTQYIQINDLDFRGGASASIKIKNNEYWTINNCNIGYNSGYGVVIKESSHIKILQCDFNSNFTVDQSQLQPASGGIDYTGCNDGIFIGGASEYIEIASCYFKNWSHASFGSNASKAEEKISFISFHHNTLTAPDIIYGGRIAYSGYCEDGEYYNNNINNISVANQLGGSRNHFHHNIIDVVKDSPLKEDKIGIGIWLENYNVQIKDNIIENNVIANTDSKGLEIYSENFDYPGEVSGNKIRNNIFYNCGITENNIAIQFHKDQSDQLIYKNIIENNLIYNSNSTKTCLYQFNGILCDVTTFNSKDADIRSNIDGNPLFFDADNGNYHLLSNSPAINAGTMPFATKDYDGNPIPNGNAADIGAFEYSQVLGIIDNSIPYKTNIYPNPIRGHLFFSNAFSKQNYTIYSILGEILKKGKIDNQGINLSNFNSGIYFVKIDPKGSDKMKILRFILLK